MNKYLTHSFMSLLFVSLFALSGCNKPGGGAAADVQVQPKVSDLAMFNAEEATPEGNDNGGTSGATKKSGTLSGQIIVEGNVSQPSMLVVKGDASVKDANVCAIEGIPDEKLLVGNNGGLGNVYIYLTKAPKKVKIPDAPQSVVPFDNIKCRFEPHALLVRTGQTVLVKNKDSVAHNTHTFPSRNDSFNQSVGPEGTPIVYRKKEKIPVLIKCDFHAWMKAYHLPLDHPYAAITDKEGKFTIKDLPPGKHKFVIWHESGGTLNTGYAVVIDGDQQVEIKFRSEQVSSFRGPLPKTISLSALP